MLSVLAAVLWLILYMLYLPLMVAALVLYPIWLLIALPLRLVGITVSGVSQRLRVLRLSQ